MDKQPKDERSGDSKRLCRILVVDDHEDTATGLAKLLSFRGHDVRIARDGESALSCARSHMPEVVLLDIGLPGKDGYEVVKELRNESCCKSAVIIAISGYGQDEDLEKSEKAGFDHHLVKPLEFDELFAIIG